MKRRTVPAIAASGRHVTEAPRMVLPGEKSPSGNMGFLDRGMGMSAGWCPAPEPMQASLRT